MYTHFPGFNTPAKTLLLSLMVGSLIALTAGCGDSEKSAGPDDELDDETYQLLPESSLSSSCVNWPEENFSQTNRTGGLRISVSTGNPSIDFTLKDVDGTSYSLSQLLESKPVLMVFGSFT